MISDWYILIILSVLNEIVYFISLGKEYVDIIVSVFIEEKEKKLKKLKKLFIYLDEV